MTNSQRSQAEDCIGGEFSQGLFRTIIRNSFKTVKFLTYHLIFPLHPYE